MQSIRKQPIVTTLSALCLFALVVHGASASGSLPGSQTPNNSWSNNVQTIDRAAQKRFLANVHPEASQVLRFWFEQWDGDMLRRGKGLFNQKWFPNGPDGVLGSREVDRIITEKFSDLFTRGVSGKLDWDIDHNPYDNLAYILLIDQFSRHIYRGKAEAYQHDALGLRTAKQNIAKGFYLYYFTGYQKLFVVAPLVHAEDLSSQQLALFYLKELNEDPQHRYEFLNVLKSAMDHYQMILMFGRFPHRNPRQDRQDTVLETAYLAKKGSKGFIDGSKW